MPAWEFQALQNTAKSRGWHEFIAMQNYYNLIYREEEREMIPYCKDAGIGCIPVRTSSLLINEILSCFHSSWSDWLTISSRSGPPSREVS